MKTPEELVALVAEAFRDDPKPPHTALIKTHCPECLETSEALAGKTWQEVCLADLLVARETALLTAAAWRYYLPAVITWCLRAPEDVDVIQDNLVYQLEPPEPGKTDVWWNERLQCGFSEAQRRAIAAYLNWYRQREDAEYAALEMEPPAHARRALEYWTTTSEEAAG